MEAARNDARLATRVWFPEDRGAHFELNNGVNCAVLIGEPAYQVSSGEIVAL
jgi:hypothetical protein